MKIVIEGAGDIGSHLAKILSREANEITVIDSDKDRLSRLSSVADVAAVQGNPSSISTFKSAGVPKADLFIAVTPFIHQDVNIVSAMIAKQLGAKKVIARVDDVELLEPENKLMLKEMGIEMVFYPEKIAADEIADQVKRSAASESMDFAHGKLHISVFKLDEDSSILDMTVGQFAAEASKGDIQFRIIAISRGDDTIIPKADTRFLYHDMVYVITTREGLPVIMQQFGKTDISISKVMIVGGSVTGQLAADVLSKSMQEVKIIEKDRDRCVYLTEALDDNVTVVNGDGRNTDLLEEENIRNYGAFVALTSRDETNVLACVVAKKFGVERTIAEVENLEYIRIAEEMGVDVVINRKLLSVGRIFKFTLSGKARFVKYMSGTDAEVLEYTVAPGAVITKGTLKDIEFPKNAIIGGVIRGSESFIAIGSTRIEAYDRVAVFAMPDAVKEVDSFFR